MRTTEMEQFDGARKCNVLGVLVDPTTYDDAVQRICGAARRSEPFPVTALAVHGLMEGFANRSYKYSLNRFGLVVPDGQPIRWFLNIRYGTRLSQRVYGPELMARLCGAAESGDLPVYLYGSTGSTLERLSANLRSRFPRLAIAGMEASKFRCIGKAETASTAERIRRSGAAMTFVGLGCPRQEVFAYEFAGELKMPTIAVGAAFDYHAGNLREPPRFMQDAGLQWLYRLCQEPRRLWRRYLVLNSEFTVLATLQCLGLLAPSPEDCEPPAKELLYG